jgi:hypothetical protein
MPGDPVPGSGNLRIRKGRPLSLLLPAVTVALLGGLLGAGELVSRCRDAPYSALRTTPALGYIGINIAASVMAHWLAWKQFAL